MLLSGEKIPFIFMPLLYYNYYFIIDFLICEWYNYTERTFLDREDSMKISEMPTEKQLKHYKELLEKRIATENIKEKIETKLEKEIRETPLKKPGIYSPSLLRKERLQHYLRLYSSLARQLYLQAAASS